MSRLFWKWGKSIFFYCKLFTNKKNILSFIYIFIIIFIFFQKMDLPHFQNKRKYIFIGNSMLNIWNNTAPFLTS